MAPLLGWEKCFENSGPVFLHPTWSRTKAHTVKTVTYNYTVICIPREVPHRAFEKVLKLLRTFSIFFPLKIHSSNVLLLNTGAPYSPLR